MPYASIPTRRTMQITLWKRSIRLAQVLDYDITFELSWSLRLDVAKAGGLKTPELWRATDGQS